MASKKQYDKCSLIEDNSKETFSFKRNIPTNIKDDIHKAVMKTSRSGKEQSLTWCRVKNTRKVFVSAKATGTEEQTQTKPCDIKHGDTERIGDLHTHPTLDEQYIGLTPSTSDIVSTVTDSASKGIPQISCITGPKTKFINCYQPKSSVISNPDTVNSYVTAAEHQEASLTDLSPFLKQHVALDFDHAVYDRKTLKRVYNPRPKDIVNDAFMKSKDIIRRNVPEHERAGYCKIIQDLNLPSPRNEVMFECMRQLSTTPTSSPPKNLS